MFVELEEESVKTRRIDCSTLKMLSKIQTENEVSESDFFSFSLRVTKVKVAFRSILISFLSENISPRVCAGAYTQNGFLVSVPPHGNHCMYTHATHKESILAHSSRRRLATAVFSAQWKLAALSSSVNNSLTSLPAAMIADPL